MCLKLQVLYNKRAKKACSKEIIITFASESRVVNSIKADMRSVKVKLRKP